MWLEIVHRIIASFKIKVLQFLQRQRNSVMRCCLTNGHQAALCGKQRLTDLSLRYILISLKKIGHHILSHILIPLRDAGGQQ